MFLHLKSNQSHNLLEVYQTLTKKRKHSSSKANNVGGKSLRTGLINGSN